MMNQPYELQRCPRCGSLNLDADYAVSKPGLFSIWRSPLFRLLKAFLSKRTTAYWICRDCGTEFPMD